MDDLPHSRRFEIPTPWRMGRLGLLAAACAGTLFLYALAVWWGDINQDEGWYLYAGRLVREGLVPYRDFVSTQGPVMAYVYAAAYPVVAFAGVFGGRLFTAMLGMFALGQAVWLAGRMAQRRGQSAFWVCFLVVAFGGLNLYQVYFTSLVKTYALASFLMLSGLVFLDYGLAWLVAEQARKGTRIFGVSFLGGLLLACAAGTRLSAAFVLPACWLPLLLHWWRRGRPRSLGIWLWGLLAGGTAGVLLVFGPFLYLAPEQLQFGLLRYHAGRSVGSLAHVVVYKVGFILRLSQAYWPLLAAGLLGIPLACGNGRDRAGDASHGSELAVPLWVCFIVVTLVHVLSVFPYDDYQVFIMPLCMVAIALPLGRYLEERVQVEWQRVCMAVSTLILLLLFAVSGSLLQGWFLAPRHLIWWPLRGESALAQLRDVGRTLREGQSRGAVDGEMLTQDTYVAVEAGYRVPAGMEMGPFANFLDLGDNDAQKYRVLNRVGLFACLRESDARWAVYSGYGFAILAPAIVPIASDEREAYLEIIRERYRLHGVVPHFGQAMTDLHVYRF